MSYHENVKHTDEGIVLVVQVRLAKERKKGDKIVSDSQERAYWRVARPPPGVVSALEPCPVPVRARHHRVKKRSVYQVTREVGSHHHISSITDFFSIIPCFRLVRIRYNVDYTLFLVASPPFVFRRD